VDVRAALNEHGMLLQSARGPLPNVAELVAGGPIRGSWWGHADAHEIFAVLNDLADDPDVVRLRLVRGKLTLVHRRVWPALVRVADELPAAGLAAVHEEHTAAGTHRTSTTPFPDWVPPEVRAAGAALSAEEAWSALPDCLRPGMGTRTIGSTRPPAGGGAARRGRGR
jgi:hypothetical protein